jgi:polyferredoxin
MKKYLVTLIRLAFLALFLLLVLQGKMVLWLGLFAASMVGALVFGRFFCGYVCPMNTVMRPVAWLSKKLKWQSSGTPAWLSSGWLALALLVISVPAMLLAKKILQRDIPVLFIFLVLSVIVTLRWRPAVFHNLLCPFGVLQKLTGRFTLYSEKVTADACIGCAKCEKVCPGDAVKVAVTDHKAVINRGLCHQCADCVTVCPTNAIRYQKY